MLGGDARADLMAPAPPPPNQRAIPGVVAGALPFSAYLLVRRRCDRRRAQMWDLEWARLDRRQMN